MARFNMWDGWEESTAKEATREDYGTIRIYSTTQTSRRTGQLIYSLTVWRGKAKKPFVNYTFRSDEHRQRNIDELKNIETRRIADKAERKVDNRREVAAMRQKATLGAIFYTSWGYDQTNREFFQVVGHKGKSTVIVREIAFKSGEATGPDSENVSPCPGQFIGEPQERRINAYGFKAHECSTAYPCGDKTSFYRSWGH